MKKHVILVALTGLFLIGSAHAKAPKGKENTDAEKVPSTATEPMEIHTFGDIIEDAKIFDLAKEARTSFNAYAIQNLGWFDGDLAFRLQRTNVGEMKEIVALAPAGSMAASLAKLSLYSYYSTLIKSPIVLEKDLVEALTVLKSYDLEGGKGKSPVIDLGEKKLRDLKEPATPALRLERRSSDPISSEIWTRPSMATISI